MSNYPPFSKIEKLHPLSLAIKKCNCLHRLFIFMIASEIETGDYNLFIEGKDSLWTYFEKV